MFSELPKLFDRDFAIAFLLPAFVFIAVSLGLLADFQFFSELFPLLRADTLQGATILGLSSLLGGAFLLILNYSIYRRLEGYGSFNPLRLLEPLEKWRFKRLHADIAKLKVQIQQGKSSGADETVLSRLRFKRDRLKQDAAERFPATEDRILPTAFGNALRAFEDYPTDMYGVDSIVVWVRLLAVIPKEYRESSDTAKAQTDFWVNLWLLSYLIFIEYFFLVISSGQLRRPWVPLLAIWFSWIASSRAKSAAIGWGDFVKSSFDLYLPELRTKLQLPSTPTINEERDVWTRFSRAIIYHRPQDVADRPPVQMDAGQKRTLPQNSE